MKRAMDVALSAVRFALSSSSASSAAVDSASRSRLMSRAFSFSSARACTVTR